MPRLLGRLLNRPAVADGPVKHDAAFRIPL
jgi:hypothetical protein